MKKKLIGLVLSLTMVGGLLAGCGSSSASSSAPAEETAEAEALIDKIDKERAHYHKYFTNSEWNDARNYDVCLDTSKVDFDKCVKIIVDYLKIKQDLSE